MQPTWLKKKWTANGLESYYPHRVKAMTEHELINWVARLARIKAQSKLVDAKRRGPQLMLRYGGPKKKEALGPNQMTASALLSLSSSSLDAIHGRSWRTFWIISRHCCVSSGVLGPIATAIIGSAKQPIAIRGREKRNQVDVIANSASFVERCCLQVVHYDCLFCALLLGSFSSGRGSAAAFAWHGG